MCTHVVYKSVPLSVLDPLFSDIDPLIFIWTKKSPKSVFVTDFYGNSDSPVQLTAKTLASCSTEHVEVRNQRNPLARHVNAHVELGNMCGNMWTPSTCHAHVDPGNMCVHSLQPTCVSTCDSTHFLTCGYTCGCSHVASLVELRTCHLTCWPHIC